MVPDEFGVREKMLFFLSPSYWGFQKDKEGTDLAVWAESVRRGNAQMTASSGNVGSPRISRIEGDTTPMPANPVGAATTDMGEEVSSLRNAAFDISSPAALRVVHLRKVFKKDCVAINDSSFVIRRGELLAIVGANGSGKSTTCHVLCGITPPTAGDALIDDRLSLKSRYQRGTPIGWCPQHDVLFDDLTPMEHVASPSRTIDNRYFYMPLFVGLQKIELAQLLKRD